LITYMRTDSFRIANRGADEVRALIAKDFGPNYVPEKPVLRRARKGAQEAHEAIRPTYVTRKPRRDQTIPDRGPVRLYRLDLARFVAVR